MKQTMTTNTTEDVEYDVNDEGGLLYDVVKSKSGRLTAKVRVHGAVTVNGVQYSYDRNIKVALEKGE